MLHITKPLERNIRLVINSCVNGQIRPSSTIPEHQNDEEFRVLNLREVKTFTRRKPMKRPDVMPPRSKQMPIDQDWGSVWPGPRSFHPASVPLPMRQGYTPKGVAPPGKFANAELMKIPNFLHLTPPIIKKQCEALKKFCTPWPNGLETEEKYTKHFPIEIITTDYCHGLPTIRNPLSRIVTIKFKLTNLIFDQHSKDKFLRLIGDRYDSKTDIVTIVTDRCPLKQQNLDYGHYLITALYHEAWITEPWEMNKAEIDMEYYDWNRNKSKETVMKILNWNKLEKTTNAPENYGKIVETLINDGENDYNLMKYKEEVINLLQLKQT